MILNKTKRIFILILCIILLFSLIPVESYGLTDVHSPHIKLTSKKNISGKGFSWNSKTQTLTLTNAKLTRGFDLPNGNTTIYLKGENKIEIPGNVRDSYGISTNFNDIDSVTFKSDGTGSLYIKGSVKIYAKTAVKILNCILCLGTDTAGYGGRFENAETGDFIVKNSRVFIKAYMNAGRNVVLDSGYLNFYGGTFDVEKNVILKNKSELDIHGYLTLEDTFTCDSSSKFKIIKINQKGSSQALKLRYGEIYSNEFEIKSDDTAIYLTNLTGDSYLKLPKEINDQYIIGTNGSSICEKNNPSVPLKEISFNADSVLADKERIKNGVESTKIKLTSEKKSRKSIKINWKKAPGYRVDYYEVYRSTDRNIYPDSPIFTTQFGLKNYYTNTKDLQYGKTYYYKVRGVREIDGEKYYTKWSTKAWRKV